MIIILIHAGTSVLEIYDQERNTPEVVFCELFEKLIEGSFPLI